MPGSTRLKAVLINLLVVIAFFTSCSVTTEYLRRSFREGMRQPASPPAADFPVVMVVSAAGQARAFVVRHEHLERFRQQFPDAGFLVPPAEAERLSAALARWIPPEEEYGQQSHQSFTMRPLTADRQEIHARVFVFDDESDWQSNGWYVATAGAITPQFQGSFSPGRHGVAALAQGFALTAGLFAALAIGWKIFRRVRARRYS